MKPRLFAVFMIIVLLPLCLMAWLGTRMAKEEQEEYESQVRELQLGQLEAVANSVERVIARWERELAKAAEELELVDAEGADSRMRLKASKGAPVDASPVFDPSEVRSISRNSSHVRQMFVMAQDGRLLHPVEPNISNYEREFLDRTRAIWDARDPFYLPPETIGDANGKEARSVPLAGWHTWFWGNGLNLLYWTRRETGYIVGMEIEREALWADIVGKLPTTSRSEEEPTERMVLKNAMGDALYQWGGTAPSENEKPTVSLALDAPLSLWTLEYYSGDTIGGSGALMNLTVGLVLLGAVQFLVAAVYFYREITREIREAGQRVSFVNQVSHELKTPLTNIRMYAELLEEDLEEADERARGYLGVVVNESQRLSRLIGNVLTFAKRKRNSIQPRPHLVVINDVVRQTLTHFRPGLESKKFVVETDLQTPDPVRVDGDMIEQVLGNLISNVEKYAASGQFLKVSTLIKSGELLIMVEDHGPGIARDQRERVFKPFHRLSDKLSDGVAGTGIGLTIARDLARLLGGDLEIHDESPGCTFCIRVPVVSAPQIAAATEPAHSGTS